MGYRFDNTPPPKPDDVKVPRFEVYNGEIMQWSFPCYYLEVEKPIDWHDFKMHDHLGWPEPRKPGHICQALPDYEPHLSPAAVWRYVDMNKAIKIHLIKESYESSGNISFDKTDRNGDSVEELSKISSKVTIRPYPDDWIVDISFKPSLTQFADKPKEFLFNTYLNGIYEINNTKTSRRDLLLRGKLVVLPGGYTTGG